MSVLDWIIGVPITLAIAYFLLVGVWMLGEVALEGYRALRFDRFGVCYKCRQPFSETRTAPADQLYGPSTITQRVCKCGTVSIPEGNRRFAEW